MAQLHILCYGKSKKRMKPIMVDTLKKCQNYAAAREHNVVGFHKIEPAEEGATQWRQKSATVGGNRCETVPRIGRGLAGYIGKNGFNPHT
jgi:hypothetical protein